ncbi:MAG TPA: glycine/sarcosine/betaine reductase complex component C subunit alpha [Clostridia bacterium]|nr:glycine/sarcosine/betaine reductase complex component C subunit alpha [Clostridia bacterium]
MSDNKAIKQLIGKTFMDIADAMQTGRFGSRVRVGLTTLGSEHGISNLVKGAELAAADSEGIDIVLIGPKVETRLEVIEANSEPEMYRKMEELLDSGYINACVTMHYSFPIGVSTVGKVVTPAMGKEMFIATTTGTASAHRVEAMVRNALYGIITAKAMGIQEPTVGILNLDGARQVERILMDLNVNGYKIRFAESIRSDGGAVMRGNDLLAGSVDVMVTDTLTGNILMKVFSSYTTGGSYEAMGCGYGPGVNESYDRIILILSRASGVPVVANAIGYAAKLAAGKLTQVAKEEFSKAKAAKLNELLSAAAREVKRAEKNESVEAPEKEVVTGTIAGVDIMELDDAVSALWKASIYAESGMGCTGPIIMVNEEKIEKSRDVLASAGFLASAGKVC